MKIRYFYPNKEGKIEFTKAQLEKLLDEIYHEGHSEGYSDGYNASRLSLNSIPITYPYTPYWYTWTSSDLPTYVFTNGQITADDKVISITQQDFDKSTSVTIGDTMI